MLNSDSTSRWEVSMGSHERARRRNGDTVPDAHAKATQILTSAAGPKASNYKAHV